MTIRIPVPFWLLRLFFGRQVSELEGRAALTGKASRSVTKSNALGRIEATLSVEKLDK